MRVLRILQTEFCRLPPALNGTVHHDVGGESWSIDASPYRAIGSASATDCVVTLPSVDRSSTRVISEVPLQTNRVGSIPSVDHSSTRVLFKELSYPRAGCSHSCCQLVFVVRVPGWIRWVKLNFSSTVSEELSTGSKDLLIEKCGAVIFCCDCFILLMCYMCVTRRDDLR